MCQNVLLNVICLGRELSPPPSVRRWSFHTGLKFPWQDSSWNCYCRAGIRQSFNTSPSLTHSVSHRLSHACYLCYYFGPIYHFDNCNCNYFLYISYFFCLKFFWLFAFLLVYFIVRFLSFCLFICFLIRQWLWRFAPINTVCPCFWLLF